MEKHEALLLTDEAHGFGVLGENGMGLVECEGLQQRATFQMGTEQGGQTPGRISRGLPRMK